MSAIESKPSVPYVDESGNTASILAFVVGVPGSVLLGATCYGFMMNGLRGGNQFNAWAAIIIIATLFALVLTSAWSVEAYRSRA